MSHARDRFIELLQRDILELDAADLDFGIYRVLNYRRSAVQRILGEELPARIEAALARLPGSAGDDEQARIYNALYAFFARYYDSGDFLPRQRRGKAARYSVPYDGSDTHFHWATKGSHYVKSGERFAAYAYRQPDGTRLRLVVAQASVERDNAKGAQRYYVPAQLQAPQPAHPGEWRLAFEHRALADDEARSFGAARKTRGSDAADDDADADTDTGEAAGASTQERLVNAWFARLAAPAPLDKALLQRHALRYARGRSTDFFVHPQLGAFLRDELDHYLQTEFINLWDLPDAALARERGKLAICRDIGRAIVDVLAALEDLQAALFEKRKFVLQAHYLVMCSWLAALGAAGAALVQRAAEHAPQVARWRQWLGEAEGSAASGAELLARCPHLPLDTALFDDAFQWELLALVPDLQAALGGVLVHGDNYAALRTLEAQWRAAVKCIYIDPPYNTPASKIAYKNDFEQSSWLALMTERLRAGSRLVPAGSPIVIAIDDFELVNLCAAIDQEISATTERNVVIVNHHPQGAGGNNVSRSHEYAVLLSGAERAFHGKLKSETGEKRPYMRSGTGQNNFRRWRENSFFAFLVDPVNKQIVGVEQPPPLGDAYPITDTEAGLRRVYPIGADGSERVWRNSYETAKRLRAEGSLSASDGFTIYATVDNEGKRGAIASNWTAKRYNAGTFGTNVIGDIFGDASLFTYPKSVWTVADFVDSMMWPDDDATVLDYFAGSGTTAHAVINLNRGDGGTRRFILVEQGEYFDTVTLPRVAKVMTSPEWKDGRPKDGVAHDPAAGDDPDAHWSRRTLPVVQVLRIERYEDSLDALALPDPAAQAAQAGQGELAGFDALLRYVTDAQDPANPVRLSTAALARPLHYRLPTVWEGRAVERPVDLLHTTLALLGLHALRLRRLERPAAAGGGVALLAEVRPHRPGQAAGAAPDLLLLREHDTDALTPAQQAAQAQAEYDWLAGAVQQHFGRALAAYGGVHHNRDLLLCGEGERGASIDAPLARAMWARDPAFSAPVAPASPSAAD
ncbi:MAG TPA: DNA methyltransferase [Rubrivivax sp.]|nr:DNA methyltransferase [Rubrivivax sp.]HPO17591.1 DNA methyltransferase [Rubrivivax sp.]